MRVLHITSEYPPEVHGGLAWHVDGLTRGRGRRAARPRSMPREEIVTRSGSGPVTVTVDGPPPTS